MTRTRPANLDLLLARYAEWRADYTGEPMEVALQGVRACVEEALPESEVVKGNDASRWAVAISLSPCAQWTARCHVAEWDPLAQDLAAFVSEYPSAELALIPNSAPIARLFQFLA